MATDWAIGGSNPSREKGFFSSRITSTWVFWAHPASQRITGSFLGNKRIEGVKIKPSGAENKSTWRYIFTPLTRLHGMDRNDLTVTFYVILEVFKQKLEMPPNR